MVRLNTPANRLPWWNVSTFEKAHVEQLTLVSELPMVSHAEPWCLLLGLRHAVDMGAFHHASRVQAAADDRSAYAKVVEHARALETLLGTEAYLLFPELRRYPGMEHLYPAIPMIRIEQFDAKWSSLHQLPSVLRHLVEMAQNCLEQPRVSQRPREVGLDRLFVELAGLYYAWFGLKPATGPNRTETDQPSLKWVGWVLKIFDEAVNNAESSEPMASLAASARGLTATSKANRLADGWKAWRELPPEDQWPPNVWFPLGRPPGATVPKGYPDQPPS